MTAPSIIHGTAAAPFDVLDDWNLAPPPRASIARPRDWRGTALQIAVTLAVAVGSYALSLGVSAERTAVTKLQAQNRALASDIRSLDAELRVRMRLPQLQRWNDEVLGLQPVSAAQFVADAATLGGKAEPRLAIAEAPATATGPILAAAPAPQRPAGLILASTGAPTQALPTPPAMIPAARLSPATQQPIAVAPGAMAKAAATATKQAAVPRAAAAAAPAKPKPAAKPRAPETPALDSIDGLIAAAAAAERRSGAPKDLLPGASGQ